MCVCVTQGRRDLPTDRRGEREEDAFVCLSQHVFCVLTQSPIFSGFFFLAILLFFFSCVGGGDGLDTDLDEPRVVDNVNVSKS